MAAHGQTDWKSIETMVDNGSYKSAYHAAETVYRNPNADARQRLTAAYWMSQSASRYQEDAYDSAVAHYRALLPYIDGVDRALCYAFLGVYDSALTDTALLQHTPAEAVREFCYEPGKTQNMTPTMYDMLVVKMLASVSISPKDKVDWQRRLCVFHAADRDDGIRIWNDLRLLQFMGDVPNSRLLPSTVQQYLDKYHGTQSPLVTDLYHLAAELCNAAGDYVQAVRYCDTAIALFPQSAGSVNCSWLRNDILAKRVSVEGLCLTLMPGAASPQRVTYRNLQHLWFRVVPYVDNFRWDKKGKQQMLNTKPVVEWDLPLEVGDSHRYETAYFALPALSAGHYLLMVSPSADFVKEGFMVYDVHCTDIVHVSLGNGRDMLLDRRSGMPIAGQEVRLVRRNGDARPERVLRRTVTDAEGCFSFDYDSLLWCDYLVVYRDGYRYEERYSKNIVRNYVDSSLRCELRVDRPVYRPADTIHAAVLAYSTNGRDGMVAADCCLRLVLVDPNGQQVSEDSVLTDDYGVAATSFVLPSDRVAGQYALNVYHGSKHLTTKWLRVEEYKQPRFTVSLDIAEGQSAPAFGKECTVQGLATAYSGVPVGSARVQYSVSRSRMQYRGWRCWNYEYDTQVAQGEVTTAADGSFSIGFVPEADSTMELDSSTAFRYTVRVDVTDLNGESHEASTSLRVGFRNTFIGLEQAEPDCRDLPQVDLHLTDINGRPLQGSMHVKVERLRRPARTLLTHNAMVPQAVRHTLSSDEWSRLFPLFAYNPGDVDCGAWPVAETVLEGDWPVADGNLKVELPQLINGYYRITATAAGAVPLEHTICLTRKDARRVQSNELLWHDIDRSRAEVGERVALQFGSAIPGTQVYYMLRVGDEDRLMRRVDCHDDAIHTEYIYVDSLMLGGFCVELFTIREDIVKQWHWNVDVPFSHKDLQVEISTFRDRLLPGEAEEWTIRVACGKRMVESAMVMTMYDDALNTYGGSDWGFHPWRHHYSASMDYYRMGLYGYSADWMVRAGMPSYHGTYPTVWNLVDALPRYYGRRHIMFKTATARNDVMLESATAEEKEDADNGLLARGVSEMVSMQAVTTGDMDVVAVSALDEAAASVDGMSRNGDGQPVVQVRQNLNNLAFFAADVRTDSTGMATYRFTVPELLTRWNVRGLAVSRDLKIGTLDKTLVTAKPLMVQPNMPRFLRQGDSLGLMAKVVRTDYADNAAPVVVVVSLLLTDAATGDTICFQSEHLPVADAAQALFEVEVPQDVYAVTYRIIATADGMADGEQGQVPVVGNRQAVTVSQSLYINGVGEKSYTLPEWHTASDTRRAQLVLVEAVSNPVWLALKAMPFLDDQVNPSTTCLANQLYVNSQGAAVINSLDGQDALSGLAAPAASPLSVNTDVKQTALQATPWLRDAEAEEEQMRAVARYFDTAALRAQRAKLAGELTARQNADGGWPWMPDGASSLWVTQNTLQRLASLDADVPTKQALEYIDREQQRRYERYIKPDNRKYAWQPTDIDYLYTRSFYGKATTEAYRFYYSNALKNYSRYDNLYTQAQLALVFHRHGDRKAALDVLRRLKEKSLESDEMGIYWRDNRSGYFWYSRPIETQALVIQAFAEITPRDTATIALMQQWLLKQKQTTHWGNERATTEAIKALMVGGGRPQSGNSLTMTVFGQPVEATPSGMEGYSCQRWTGDALERMRLAANDTITIAKSTPGIAWASVYYQFTDNLDKIPASDMGISIKRSYLNLSTPNPTDTPKVGDRLKVRLEITADRAMDYLELVDGRPSCTEPLDTRAGWRWCDGLNYYVTVGNTDTRFYIEHIDKGRYVAEYELYVTNPGTFVSGVATMQCMYAPDFRAVAPSQVLVVKP